MRVSDLLPGDTVTLLGSTATFITHTEHPIWPELRLVIWKLDDGSFSFDALSDAQEIGDVTPSSPDTRLASIRKALLTATPRVFA